MSSQSIVVPLPVLMKDEKKADLVDVFDQMEVCVREIYAKAGLCAPANEDHIPPGSPIAANPVQTNQQHMSHQYQKQMIHWQRSGYPVLGTSSPG